MSKFETQKQWVRDRIMSQGFITRNECLRNYISRLGAIICDLKKEGLDFDTQYIESETSFGKSKDFKYTLRDEQKIK